ncbi:hypothetical protein LCGC14_2796000, partial [marine sediment metagenome]
YWEVGSLEKMEAGSPNIITAGATHTVELKNLKADTSYAYVIKSKDINEAEAVYPSDLNASRTFRTAAFRIEPGTVQVEDKGVSGATIEWNSNIAAGSRVIYYEKADPSKKKSAGRTTTSSASHSVKLLKLKAGVTYTYEVLSIDPSGAETTKQSGEFTTDNFSINSLSRSASSSKATVAWKTNLSANSKVEYWEIGKDHKYSGLAKRVSLKSGQYAHKIVLENLKPGANYDFRVISEEVSGEKIIANGAAFSTQSFRASSVKVVTTVSSAIVTWNTNEDSDSFVEFGKKSTNENVTGDNKSTGNHKIIIRKLSPGTKYKFKVLSKDSNNNVAIKSDSDNSFTTKPFKITGAKKTTSTNSATITWKTNVASTSSVEYRSAANKVSQLAGDAKLTKTHKVEVKGLEDNTTYS